MWIGEARTKESQVEIPDVFFVLSFISDVSFYFKAKEYHSINFETQTFKIFDWICPDFVGAGHILAAFRSGKAGVEI